MADKTLSVRLAMVNGNFNKQIQTITKESKLLESEFKAIEAGSKDFAKTLDGQKAKLKLLEGTYSNAKKKVEVYNKAVEAQKKTIEKAEKAVDEKKKSLTDMNKKLVETEKTYGKNSKEVKEFKEKIKDAEKSLKQKENALVSASDKMTKYKTDMNGAIGECNKLEREIRETNEAISNMEKDIKITVDMNKDASDGVNELGNSIDNTVDKSAKLSIIAQGLTDVGDRAREAGKNILDGLGGLASAGGEYEILLNKIKIQLGANEQAVRSWASQNSKSLGLTDLQLVSLVGNNNMLAKKMGLTGDAAIEQAKAMAVLVQNFSTFEDIDLVEAQERFKSALNGSTQIMDQYGVDLSKATLEQNSYFKSLKKNWNSLTETEKKMIRLDQITKDLAHTQGNAEAESDSYNVQLALLKANTAEIAATLGQELIPLLQPIVEKVGQVATAFANWVKENPKLAQILLIIAAAIGVILTVLGSILVPIGLCITSFMGLSAACATLGVSVGALLSPILLVIGAILAIIAIVTVLIVKWDEIKVCWDNFINWSSKKWTEFKDAFIKKWTEIKENAIQFGKDLANAVKESWNSFITWATTKWNNFSTWFIKKWTEIKENAIQFGKDLANAIKESWTSFINWLESWADRLANLVNSTWQSIKDTAIRWGNNLVDGLRNAFNLVFDVITSPFRKAWEFISGIGSKIGGLISKLNPFSWFSLDNPIEANVAYSGLDNVALSGSYYNSNTRASNNLSDFIKLSNNIPSKNNMNNVNNTDINTRLLGNQIASAILQALNGVKLNAEINTEINGRQVAGAVTNSVIKNVDSQIKSRNWR